MSTASTATEEVYWGVGGEYGPFPVQTTGEWVGWPNFGKVMRYFREKAKMTIEQFAETYGRKWKANHSPISRRQVEYMEYENAVPIDMNKRKFIAHLLNIPPMLFGLAALEDATLRPHPQIAGAYTTTGQSKLIKVVADITKYQNNIRMFWLLHQTSEAHSKLNKINVDIQDLKSLESQTRGDLRYHIRELLFSYHILLAHVVRDRRNFSLSHHHANQAVRIAKAESDTDLIATALFTRGCTYLEWGMFGTLTQGIFQIQKDKIIKAIHNFEEAKRTPENGEEGLHPQLLGNIRIHLSRAHSILKLSNGKPIPALAFTMIDDAADNVGKQHIEDLFQRVIITGGHNESFKQEGYHSGRAAFFNASGMPGAALEEINKMEALQEGTLGKDLTRSQTWLDIVKANTHMGLEQFEVATKRAKRAVLASQDIKSTTSLSNLVDIHGRLLKSPYKNEADVEELGDMLREMIANRTKQEQIEMEEDY